MVKERLTEEIERRIEESDTISADDLNVEQRCEYCDTPMPYEHYNERSPQVDYVCHIVPTADEHSPPQKHLYCTPTCLTEDLRETEKRLYDQ